MNFIKLKSSEKIDFQIPALALPIVMKKEMLCYALIIFILSIFQLFFSFQEMSTSSTAQAKITEQRGVIRKGKR